MPAKTVEVVLTGNNAKAISAINQVGTAAEKNAKKGADAFDKTASRVGGSFTKLGSLGASFGVPFSSALTAVGSKLDASGKKTESFGKKLEHVGDTVAIGAAAGLAVVGGAAIKAALEGEASQARIETAIKNTGQSYDEYAGKIDSVAKHMADFGIENDQVNDAIAALIPVTHDTQKAIDLMGLAADIAAARHISLMDATKILVATENGRYGQLVKLGVVTKEQSKDFKNTDDAIKVLTNTYKGSAAAAADTYSGKLAAVSAKVSNLEEELGNQLLPVVADVASGILDGIDAFSSFNETLDGVPGKIAAVGGAALAATYVAVKLTNAYKATAEALGPIIGKILGKAAAEEADAVAATESATATGVKAAALDAETLSAEGTTVALEEVAGAEEAAAAAGAGPVFATLAASVVAVGAAAYGVGAALDAMVGTMGNMGPGVDEVKDLGKALIETGDSANKASDQLRQLVGAEATDELKQYADQLLAGAKASDLSALKSKAVGDAAINAGRAFLGASDAAKLSDDDIRRLAKSNEALNLAMERTSTGAEEAAGTIEELTKKYGAAGVQTAELQAAQKQYADDLASGHASEQQLAADKAAVITASEKQTTTQNAVNDATREGSDAATENAGAVQEQADASKELADNLNALYSAQNAALGSSLSLREATFNVGKALEEQTDKAKIAMQQHGKNKEANDDLTQASFGLEHAILNVASSAQKNAEDAETLRQKNLGLNDASLIATKGHEAEVGALQILAQQYPGLRGQIQQYIDKLGGIPPAKSTKVTATVEYNIPPLHINVPNIAIGEISYVYQGQHIGAPIYQHPRAEGGPVDPGGSFLVGEKGPELFIPRRSGVIVPNDRLVGYSHTPVPFAAMNASPTVNITLRNETHVDPISGRAIHRLVQEDQSRNGPWKIRIRA